MPGAGAENILFQKTGRIVFPLINDPALGVERIGFGGVFRTGGHNHLQTRFRQTNCRNTAGNAAADNQNVGLDTFVHKQAYPISSMR